MFICHDELFEGLGEVGGSKAIVSVMMGGESGDCGAEMEFEETEPKTASFCSLEGADMVTRGGHRAADDGGLKVGGSERHSRSCNCCCC